MQYDVQRRGGSVYCQAEENGGGGGGGGREQPCSAGRTC